MSFKNKEIEIILPENKIHWKINFCPKRRLELNEYRISIELSDKKRQYTCISFEDLFKLIEKIPVEKRTFHEHISREDSVKFYLDLEYYRTNKNMMMNVKQVLSSVQKLFINMIRMISNCESVSINDTLLLTSSSCDKESYHIILDDNKIRFLSTYSLHLFIKEIFRYVLILTLNHECIYNRKFTKKHIDNECDLLELIKQFECVRLDWFACVECKLKYIELYVSDVCNLFAYNTNGSLVSCIDLKVYSVEQDFRMFMCTKVGENRPLVKSTILTEDTELKSEKSSILTIKETLQKSLITEPSSNVIIYINDDSIDGWKKSIGLSIRKDKNRRVQNEVDNRKKISIQNEVDNRKKFSIRNDEIFLSTTDRERNAEIWARTYLKKIDSSGIIHSINTGRNGRLILCNIRNMNICKSLHEDYFNDSTVYINLEEKQFSIRCNRIPCNKKSWVWQPMI